MHEEEIAEMTRQMEAEDDDFLLEIDREAKVQVADEFSYFNVNCHHISIAILVTGIRKGEIFAVQHRSIHPGASCQEHVREKCLEEVSKRLRLIYEYLAK